MTLITCVVRSDIEKTYMFYSLRDHTAFIFPRADWPDSEDPLETLRKASVQRERSAELEQDDSLLQIIPYLAIKNKQGDYLCYVRQGQEERLHNKVSIGIGGHVHLTTDSQQAFAADLSTELHREAEEELGKEAYSQIDWSTLDRVGLIYTPSDDVGKVHLGLLYVVEIDSQQEQIQSEECGTILIRPQDKLEELGELEAWSSVAVKLLNYVTSLDLATKSHYNNFTGIRVQGSSDASISPQRDMAMQATGLLSDAMVDLARAKWPQSTELFERTDSRYEDNVIKAFHAVNKLLAFADKPTKDSDTYIDALKLSGFFDVSLEGRLGFLSHIGLNMLAHMWVSVRQYSAAGYDPAAQYELVFTAAANAMRQALGAEESMDVATEFVARQAKAKNLDRSTLLRLVGEAYDK